MKDVEKKLTNRAEYVIINHIDDHERDRYIMSEQSFKAISWFITKYNLDDEYEILLKEEEVPQELPF